MTPRSAPVIRVRGRRFLPNRDSLSALVSVRSAGGQSMNCLNGLLCAARFLAQSAVVLLALLAILGCGDSTEEPGPSPTARSVLFATPPAATSTGAGDESGSDISVELDQTATPYPTSTPYPTATPYPTPTPYPVAVRDAESTSGAVTETAAGPTSPLQFLLLPQLPLLRPAQPYESPFPKSPR